MSSKSSRTGLGNTVHRLGVPLPETAAGRHCDTVIADGVEREPLLRAKDYLLKHAWPQVISGLQLAMSLHGARQGIIAVRGGSEPPSTEPPSAEPRPIKVVKLGSGYPFTGRGLIQERLLVRETTARLVPPAAPPQEIAVYELETLYNLQRALVEGSAVTRRLLTCTGAVARPGLVRAHIGSTMGEVIAACGGIKAPGAGGTYAKVNPAVTGGSSAGPTAGSDISADIPRGMAVLAGGPLSGTLTTDLDTPVSKQTEAVLVLPMTHKLVQARLLPLEWMIKRSKSVCLQCARCTEFCPSHKLGYPLTPHELMRQISYGLQESSPILQSVYHCLECGLCAYYACPTGLSPLRVIRAIKERLAGEGLGPEAVKTVIKAAAETGGGQAIHSRWGVEEAEIAPGSGISPARLMEQLSLSSYEPLLFPGISETDPRRVELLLKQQEGPGLLPSVNVEDSVLEGEPIAVPAMRGGSPGEFSRVAALHASISGRITLVDTERIVISA